MIKTFNPFKIFGSWAGLLLGYFFFLKGVDAFAFVFEYTGIPVADLLARNLTAGFMLGFALHIFIRATLNIAAFKRSENQQLKEYKDK